METLVNNNVLRFHPLFISMSYEVTDYYAINPTDSIQKIVDRINSYTKEYRSLCAEYKFDWIHKLYNRSLTRDDSEFKLGDSLICVIQVFLNPGMALFETVLRGFDGNSRFEIVSEITRINLYGNQSHCIQYVLYFEDCF